MTRPLTIVMYHYVRDLARTRFPDIKALDLRAFRQQIDRLSAAYTIVTMEEVLHSISEGEPLPADAALLTFDDGYLDHYSTVFPILHAKGLQGSFFPPVAPVRDRTLLDVNRVHFILASVPSPERLGAVIDEAVEAASSRDDVDDVQSYRATWAVANRFDDAETIYVKRMLQTALPLDLREQIARSLFSRYVTADEEAFGAELYMSEDQAAVMVANGMFFGSHGRTHLWLDRVDRATMHAEIDGSLEFLRALGMPVEEQWVMCYPYGGWSDDLLEVLRTRRCTAGLTTRVEIADLASDDPLLLPRFDTNDFL